MSKSSDIADVKVCWTSLITNLSYLPGLLTLEYSLRRNGSKFPLVALFTDTFPEEGHQALDRRGIKKLHVKYVLPVKGKDYSNDPRFYDCWSKLTPFGLTQFDRVVQLDSDMIVLRNMDELMDVALDDPALGGKGDRVFAASHACVCNPLKKAHYPKDWTPENCAFTSQHGDPENAQRTGAGPTAGLGMPNGGLQVVRPSQATYDIISTALADEKTMQYEFADQSLLGDVFNGRWVALPYIYNALKTMRWPNVHAEIWRDDAVKNVHYILSPKPWDKPRGEQTDQINLWWWDINDERVSTEKKLGIEDNFQ